MAFGKAYCPKCKAFIGFVRKRGDELECPVHGDFSADASGRLKPFIYRSPTNDGELYRTPRQLHGMCHTRS